MGERMEVEYKVDEVEQSFFSFFFFFFFFFFF